MEVKKVLGAALALMGVMGLIMGVVGIFEKGQILGISPWPLAILGFIFFSSGIGLLRTVGGSGASE